MRNSGATTVVEGIGDHGCEYMTNGQVVVLGTTGNNFGAGMSGGLAYVLDQEGTFEKRCNRAMVTLERLSKADDITALKGLIYKHLEVTESGRAKDILADWPRFEPLFWKIVPLAPAIPIVSVVLSTTAPDPVKPPTSSGSSEPAKV